MNGLTTVMIDFDTSHLLFPALVAGVLGLLGLAILVRDRRRILAAGPYWRSIVGAMDKPRFVGTLVLTVVYFLAMVPIGYRFPNTGLGFLICSVPYVFLTGVLFLHERGARAMLPVLVTAVVAPTLVWWLFTELFFLTLP